MIPCSYISQLLVFPLIFSPWKTGFPRIHPNLLSRPFESSPLSLSTVSLFLNSVSSMWKYSFLPHCQSFRSSVFVNIRYLVRCSIPLLNEPAKMKRLGGMLWKLLFITYCIDRQAQLTIWFNCFCRDVPDFGTFHV